MVPAGHCTARAVLAGLAAFITLALPALTIAQTSEPLVIPRLLSRGSQGADVVKLQTFLKEEGLFLYPTATGFFGPATESAVQSFQRQNNVETIGHVGPITRLMFTIRSAQKIIAALLGSAASAPASPTVTVPSASSGGRV